MDNDNDEFEEWVRQEVFERAGDILAEAPFAPRGQIVADLQMAAWVAANSTDTETLLKVAGLLVADARRLCDHIPAASRAAVWEDN